MNADATSHQLPALNELEILSDEDRALLGSFGHFRSYMPEQVVIHEGNPQDRLYFLIDGTLDVVHESEGGATPVGRIQEGEWFGEINIFDADVASATVIARSPCTAWFMSRPKLEEFLNEHPLLGCQVLLSVSEVMARRMRGTLAKLNATWELSY